jgi:sigma-B regulation protein RsbU (phosphoserine phosphatase)
MNPILVIDDDSIIRVLLQRTLSQQGYPVIVASSGEEGLEIVRKVCPALVICDWLMPGIDGLEVCRKIKSLPELSTTFFILLTSLKSVSDRIHGLDAGADDFLCKPIEMDELAARVRSGLRIHQLSYDLQKQKRLLEAELAEAADYVSSILPEKIHQLDLDIENQFLPSRQLGGDGFDYYWLDKNHLVIYLLDVSGHGLRAALPALSVINLIRSQGLTSVNYYQPSHVLTALNHTFKMDYRNDRYFTIWYGVFDCKNRQLTYSCAGHPPAILLTQTLSENPKKQLLKTEGLPIGMFSKSEYIESSVDCQSGTSLYLFSDGIYEVMNPEKVRLGWDKFTTLLSQNHTPNKFNLELILNHVKKFMNNSHFEDDVSLVQVNFKS